VYFSVKMNTSFLPLFRVKHGSSDMSTFYANIRIHLNSSENHSQSSGQRPYSSDNCFRSRGIHLNSSENHSQSSGSLLNSNEKQSRSSDNRSSPSHCHSH